MFVHNRFPFIILENEEKDSEPAAANTPTTDKLELTITVMPAEKTEPRIIPEPELNVTSDQVHEPAT